MNSFSDVFLPFCFTLLQELRQVFDRVDTTKSGTLTLPELKAAFRRVDPLLPDSAVEEIMTMLDLEAVGSVSFEEASPLRVFPPCAYHVFLKNVLKIAMLFYRHPMRLFSSFLTWFGPFLA